MSNRTYIGSAVPALRLVFLMWLVFFIESSYHFNFGFLGILPREWEGLMGVVFAPVLHGDVIHLISNTFPLIFLGSVLFFFYNSIASRVFLHCYFTTNFFVWLLARSNSYHIGASGLVYGLAAFLIVFGLLRREPYAIIISITVTLVYGSIFYGVLPNNPYISWESHLIGAIVGVILAFRFKKKRIY